LPIHRKKKLDSALCTFIALAFGAGKIHSLYQNAKQSGKCQVIDLLLIERRFGFQKFNFCIILL
jgi:hypothetical protein